MKRRAGFDSMSNTLRSIRLLFSDEMLWYERTMEHNKLLLFFLVSFCVPSPSFDPFVTLCLCGTSVTL